MKTNKTNNNNNNNNIKHCLHNLVCSQTLFAKSGVFHFKIAVIHQVEGEQEKFVELEHCACRIYNVPVLLKETLSPLILPSVQPSPGNHQISVDRAMGLLLWANFIPRRLIPQTKTMLSITLFIANSGFYQLKLIKGILNAEESKLDSHYASVKEAISLLILCAPVFIFTSGSSALLGHTLCGLLIWLLLRSLLRSSPPFSYD